MLFDQNANNEEEKNRSILVAKFSTDSSGPPWKSNGHKKTL